jgi:hypothetical protein
VIEPYRVSTETTIRASVASLPAPGRRDLAIALQALSQVIAVQEALGEQFDESPVDVFGQGAVLLYYRIVQHERTIQVVELLWLG